MIVKLMIWMIGMIKIKRIDYFWFSGSPNIFEKEHFGQKLLVHFQFGFHLMMITIMMVMTSVVTMMVMARV